MEEKATKFLEAEILKTERRVFAGRILATLFGYVLFSTWLSYVRATAPLWFVWILIITQLLLYFLIFTMSYQRVKEISFKTFGIIPFIILAALGRVNDWELVIIPGLIIAMLIISARTKTMSAEGQAILQPSPDKLQKMAQQEGERTVKALNSLANKEASAKIIEYANYSKDMPLDCPICHWQGTPSSSGLIEYHNDVLDVSCPNCKEMILVVGYPLSPDFSQR